jgi:hypothetical protein
LLSDVSTSSRLPLLSPPDAPSSAARRRVRLAEHHLHDRNSPEPADAPAAGAAAALQLVELDVSIAGDGHPLLILESSTAALRVAEQTLRSSEAVDSIVLEKRRRRVL